VSNGQFFPGLMYVVNPAPDNSRGWYLPNEQNPPGGACYTSSSGLSVVAWTAGSARRPAVWGITLCPRFFQSPTTQTLGKPQQGAGLLTVAYIERYRNTGGVTILHELTHLVDVGERNPAATRLKLKILT